MAVIEVRIYKSIKDRNADRGSRGSVIGTACTSRELLDLLPTGKVTGFYSDGSQLDSLESALEKLGVKVNVDTEHPYDELITSY